jgi:hypothetical protein
MSILNGYVALQMQRAGNCLSELMIRAIINKKTKLNNTK